MDARHQSATDHQVPSFSHFVENTSTSKLNQPQTDIPSYTDGVFTQNSIHRLALASPTVPSLATIKHTTLAMVEPPENPKEISKLTQTSNFSHVQLPILDFEEKSFPSKPLKMNSRNKTFAYETISTLPEEKKITNKQKVFDESTILNEFNLDSSTERQNKLAATFSTQHNPPVVFQSLRYLDDLQNNSRDKLDTNSAKHDKNGAVSTTSLHKKSLEATKLDTNKTKEFNSVATAINANVPKYFTTLATQTLSETESFKTNLRTNFHTYAITGSHETTTSTLEQVEINTSDIITKENNLEITATSALNSELDFKFSQTTPAKTDNIFLSQDRHEPLQLPFSSIVQTSLHSTQETEILTFENNHFEFDSYNTSYKEGAHVALDPISHFQKPSNEKGLYVTKVTISTFKIISHELNTAKLFLHSKRHYLPLILDSNDELIGNDHLETLIQRNTQNVLHNEETAFKVWGYEELKCFLETGSNDFKDDLTNLLQQHPVGKNQAPISFQLSSTNAFVSQQNLQLNLENATSSNSIPLLTPRANYNTSTSSINSFEDVNINPADTRLLVSDNNFRADILDNFVEEPFFISAHQPNSSAEVDALKTESKSRYNTDSRNVKNFPKKSLNGDTIHPQYDNSYEGSSNLMPDYSLNEIELSLKYSTETNLSNDRSSEISFGSKPRNPTQSVNEGSDQIFASDESKQAPKANAERAANKLAILDAIHQNDANKFLGIMNHNIHNHYHAPEDEDISGDLNYDHNDEYSYFADEGKFY